jgi:purine-binding chemotaxis protein CheW
MSTVAPFADQFLTFALGQAEYNAPAFIKGVMNLRGTIVPIIDLRKKFAMAEVATDQFTVIVVVQVQSPPAAGEAAGKKQIVGFVVDAVRDVLDVAGTDIQPTPDLYGQIDTSFLNGLAKAGDKLVILLDIEKVLTAAETAQAVVAAGQN